MHLKMPEVLKDTVELASHETDSVSKDTHGGAPSRRKAKRVRFVCDERLVSIREIPARPPSSCAYSTESSASSDDSSSSSSSSSDSDSSDSDSSDSQVKLSTRFSRMSPGRVTQPKLALKVTTSNTQQRKAAARPPPKKAQQSFQTNKAHQLRVSASNEQTRKSEAGKKADARPTTPLSRARRKAGSQQRPSSCSGPRMYQYASSLRSRPSSAAPLINLSLIGERPAVQRTKLQLNRQSMATPQSGRPTKPISAFNSGQERTKVYAWQVANGAPLVTTPGITPFCSEQVSITKL